MLLHTPKEVRYLLRSYCIPLFKDGISTGQIKHMSRVEGANTKGHTNGLNRWIQPGAAVEKSTAHGEDLTDRINFSTANLDGGRIATDCMYGAAFFGLLANYANSFWDSKIASQLFSTVSSFFEGKRDEEMYKIYGMGQGVEFTPEELKNQELTLKKVPFADDLLEDKRRAELYGEHSVAFWGEQATKVAKIKPILHVAGGILGDKYRRAIETVLDMPARFWWRLRFFGNSLHDNFATSAWNLAKYKILGLFNPDSKKEYVSVAKKLNSMALQYFEENDKENIQNHREHSSSNNLGLYFKMLTHRIKEHYTNFRNQDKAREVITKKIEDGVVNLDDFMSPEDSKKYTGSTISPEEKATIKTQAIGQATSSQQRISLVDLTAPFCAGFGLIASAIFDPLKVIWGLCNIEKGKHLINGLSASRKAFQLLNYIPRFCIPEIEQGSRYTDIDPNDPSYAQQLLRYGRKERYNNGLVGMVMAVGNIVEPLLHFRRGSFEDNKFISFLFDTFVKFNDDAFLRFFSKRRWSQGVVGITKSLAHTEADGDIKKLELSSESLKKRLDNVRWLNHWKINGSWPNPLQTKTIMHLFSDLLGGPKTSLKGAEHLEAGLSWKE